jgi:glucan biosynthesis protein C
MAPTDVSLAQAAALADERAATGAGRAGRRLYFMDNLRVVLTVLIVLQHASFAYAAGSWWYYVDQRQEPMLAAFFVVNRSFRMSLFFLIAGYFMPYVFDRKGWRDYLKDRFRRLGLPILFFVFLVFPLLMYAYYLNFRGYPYMAFASYYWHIYWGFGYRHGPDWTGPNWPDRQLGHLWFVQMLLIYALGYAAWRWLRQKIRLPRLGLLPQPGFLTLLPVLLAVAAASFAVRLNDPIYRWHGYLGMLQLQPADLPRDLACFTFGVLSFRNDWLLTLPKRKGYGWLALGVAGALAFVVCDFAGYSFFSAGGRDLKAMVYPLWETFTCFGLCLGLPTLFREKLDFQTPFLRRLSIASYGVYLFHLPMVVALQYALAQAALPAAVKFLLVGFTAVPAAFLFTWCLLRWPAARRVI